MNNKNSTKLRVGDTLTLNGQKFNIGSPFLAGAFQRLVKWGRIGRAAR